MPHFALRFRLVVLLGSSFRTLVRSLQFGLINGGSAFFDPVKQGWDSRCKALGVTCVDVVGRDSTVLPGGEDCLHRQQVIQEWISQDIDGIALTPCSSNRSANIPIIEQATQAGVPIVTFDTDVPESVRAAYVGTDNRFLGRTMARLLRQLRPNGGTFAFVGKREDRELGFIEEITKFNERDDRPHWYEVESEYSINDPLSTEWIKLLEHSALMNPTAIITMIQSPMREANWTDFVDANRHRNITYIGTDGADYQLSYLSRRYVDGLVGQLPYDMGSLSLQALYDLANNRTVKPIIPTNLVSYNLIPLELPPPDVDMHLLDSKQIVGFVCFGLVTVFSIACVTWSVYYRADMVVRAAQPFFLAMVATGVLVMAASLIPLSFDDKGDPEFVMDTTRSTAVCMSIPWLLFTGFAITISALLSKTWRVNRLFNAKGARHQRIQVSVKDVLLPSVLLLTAIIVVLICWTVLDPLMYQREEDIGTDAWNREISSYGACHSDSAVAYLTPLAVLNACAVVIACWQAYHARGIKAEFSEAKYIGLAVCSMCQALLTGIPVTVVVRDNPEAFYLVLTFTVFLLCMVILSLIFLPKMVLRRKYAQMSEIERKMAMQRRISQSSADIKRTASKLPDQAIDSFGNNREDEGIAEDAPSAVAPNSKSWDGDDDDAVPSRNPAA